MNTQIILLTLNSLRHKFGRFAIALVVALVLVTGLHLAFASPVYAQVDPALPVPAANEETTEVKPEKEDNIIQRGVKCGANFQFDADKQQNCEYEEADKEIRGTLENILGAFSLIAGTAAVVMIIYAGFRYIVSGGDEKGVKTAKNTMIYAIVGIVLVMIAQVIINFVLGKV